MGPLTNPRHERFAQELAKGKPACEAYVIAGYKANDGNASTLKGNQKVEQRLAELQAKAAVRTELTLADIIEELEEARQAALSAATPQTGSAVSATLGKAKLLGLIVDKSEVKGEFEVTDARERLAHKLAGIVAAADAARGAAKPH